MYYWPAARAITTTMVMKSPTFMGECWKLIRREGT